MFYAVLLLIGLTNLALGYAVAIHFGFGPKPYDELDAAFSDGAAAKPSFAILGGRDETPLSELPPAKPIDAATRDEPTTVTAAATTPEKPREKSTDAVPAEVRDFTALGATAPTSAMPAEEEATAGASHDTETNTQEVPRAE